MSKKAVILFSGGLDSTTLLFYAKSKGYKPYCLIFDYGQKHKREISSAIQIAKKLKLDYQSVKIDLPWKGSALVDKKIKIPQNKKPDPQKIPSTYVPARNTIFISHALSYAEAIKAQAVFIGANAIDYSGYPDCRPEFFKAFQEVANKGLKAGVEKNTIKILAPLVHKTKPQIIKMGLKMKVPYDLTWSCYKGGKKPCLKCESCQLRIKAFEDLKMVDPLIL